MAENIKEIKKELEKNNTLAVILSNLDDMQKENDKYTRSFIHDEIIKQLANLTDERSIVL